MKTPRIAKGALVVLAVLLAAYVVNATVTLNSTTPATSTGTLTFTTVISNGNNCPLSNGNTTATCGGASVPNGSTFSIVEYVLNSRSTSATALLGASSSNSTAFTVSPTSGSLPIAAGGRASSQFTVTAVNVGTATITTSISG